MSATLLAQYLVANPGLGPVEAAVEVLVANITGLPAAGVSTPTVTSVNSSGTVSAGARSLVFIFSADFVGTVLGVAFTGENDKSLEIPIPNGTTSAAVAYTVTAGSIRILKTV